MSNRIQPGVVSERVRLLRDSTINSAFLLVSGTVAIVLIPFMLSRLGAELYGLWIAALAVTAILQVLDFGLGFAVIRAVGASLGSEDRGETARFLTSAGRAFVAISLLGALLIGAIGPWLSQALNLSPESLNLTPAFFAFIGLAFLMEQVFKFELWILCGLRRFDTANSLAIAVVLLRAAGIIGVLSAGAGLIGVAAWHAAASAAAVVLARRAVNRLEPCFRWRLGSFRWASLRPHVRFSLLSQLTTAVGNVIPQTGSLLIGLVHGSSFIVPYYVGQRFPMAVSEFNWRAAQVLFPAASEQQQAADIARTRETLLAGTRFTVAVALPLSLILLLLGPSLLQVWVEGLHPDAALILRLTALVAIADAFWVATVNVLWGRGAVLPVLYIFLGVAAANLGLTLLLLPLVGIVGAAWGFLLALTAGSLVCLRLGSHLCRVSLSDLLRSPLEGMLRPLLACGTTAYALAHLVRPDNWFELGGILGAAGIVYGAFFYRWGANQSERMFVTETLDISARALLAGYDQLSRALRRVPGALSRSR
jgi:O-antigen/teichoic acid export membrane protein